MIGHPLLNAERDEGECTMREKIDDLGFIVMMALIVLGGSGLEGLLR